MTPDLTGCGTVVIVGEMLRAAEQAATLRERERCAGIADALAADWGRRVGCGGYAAGAAATADAIRSGEDSP